MISLRTKAYVKTCTFSKGILKTCTFVLTINLVETKTVTLDDIFDPFQAF